MSKIIHGDSLDVLKTLADNSVDTVITDPPYGYSFMGKDWDKAVPSVEIWKECLRVLKPGAFCLVMSAPRSDVQQAMVERLIQGGFRLDFTPIYWTYASGFPKAGNIGKLVDKRLGVEREVIGKLDMRGAYDGGTRNSKSARSNQVVGGISEKDVTAPTSPEAKALDGSYAGFQPKPAVEVIIVAMKPLSEKTYVDQAMTNGHGVSWLDDGRIPTAQAGTTGRFPANLLVSDDVLNDGVNSKSHGGGVGTGKGAKLSTNTVKYGGGIAGQDYPDSGSYSRYFDLDKWYERKIHELQVAQGLSGMDTMGVHPTGDIPNISTLPFIVCPKAAKSEKNKGLDEFEERQTSGQEVVAKGGTAAVGNHNPVCQTCKKSRIDRGIGICTCHLPDWRAINKSTKNHHPTVKPLKLMSYLITLFSREGDTVLDPFVGSGTTVVAAHQLGRKGIGIEREAEYVEIAEARLGHEKTKLHQKDLFEEVVL